MPTLTAGLAPHGPLIDVIVEVSEPRARALSAAGQAVPQGVSARFLIDTGASATCVDTAIIQSLQLQPTGTITVHTPSTGTAAVSHNQYDVRIVLPHASSHRHWPAIPIVESNLRAQGLDGLLGRDILSDCLLVYNGEEDSYTLAF